jgi:type IV secretion system protein VirB11
VSILGLAAARKLTALKTALGSKIMEAMADSEVNEILVNADGAVWIDRTREGRAATGTAILSNDLERAIRLLADLSGATVNQRTPHVSGAMPFGDARFQGEVNPAVSRPVLTIRKQSRAVMSLRDLADGDSLNETQLRQINAALDCRLNIIIAGGTSSGKTTLANAMILSNQMRADRILVIEDTPELRCASLDHVQLRSRADDPNLSARELVKVSLRLRPDRIVVGELRDHAALDLIKAWNTGHPGGIATLHANSAADAMARLDDLILEGAPHVPRQTILSAVNMIVFMRREGGLRRIVEIAKPTGWSDGAYRCAPYDANELHPKVDWQNIPL